MDIYYQRNNKNIFFKLIQIFSFLSIIKTSLTECSRDYPILKDGDGECKLDYCSKSDFESKKCEINNTIIKTQWLNNIIIIGDEYYRYINFGTFSNGDMMIETNSYPAKRKRMLYGLKQNGRPLFIVGSIESSHYSLNFTGENEGKFESEAVIIKSTYNYKEFFFSVSKLDCNAEILDYEMSDIYYKPSRDFANIHNIVSLRHSIFPDIYTFNEKLYYFCFIGEILDFQNRYYVIFLQKHEFKQIDNNFVNISTKISEIIESNAYGYGVSCFQSPSGLVYCLYLTQYNNIYFNLTKYENDFTNKVSLDFESNVNNEYNFFKCIHFKDEIIVMIYYHYFTNVLNPIIIFKEFNIENQKFENYFSEGPYISGIQIKKTLYNNLLLNDFIKLNNNKFVFAATVEDKETLYIILINIFGNRKVKIRYYSIKIYELYHYKLLFDLRMNNYNNFVALASSFCPQKECSSDNDKHYSSLMIFSYPNNTDITIQMEKEILSNNIQSFDDYEIDLDNDNLILENNIFGYIFSSKIINELSIAGNYKLFSSKNEEKELQNGCILEMDEKIKLKYIGNFDYFETFNIGIKYYYNVTEPELNIYNNYPEDIEGDDDDVLFENEQYSGRLIYLRIVLGQTLTTECTDNNCKLCYKNDQSNCLSCKYNSLLNNDFGVYRKICLEGNTSDTIEDKNIDTILELSKDNNSDDKIETIINDKTDKITDDKAEKKVDDKTETIMDNKTEIIMGDKNDGNNKIITDIINNNDEEKICVNEIIIETKFCKYSISEKQLKDLYTLIKEKYILNNNNEINTIFQSENVIYQISNHEDQKNSDNINISSIDLGLCEEQLKHYYHIPDDESLIIYKIDIKSEDLLKTYVLYEVYNPIKLEKLDVSICKDTNIIINSPVQLDDTTSILYDSLKESGYDLFNESDSFYNDICSTYTSLNKTDITLADRKQIYLNNNGNITLCQTGCELEYYNSKTRKAKCQCFPENNKVEDILNPSYIQFNLKMISENFNEVIKKSNFMVLKCYKIALDLSTIGTNIGRICMLFIFLFCLILMIFFYIKDSKNIDKYLKIFLNSKYNINSNLLKFENKREKVEIKSKNTNNKKVKNKNTSKPNENNKIDVNKFMPPKKTYNHLKTIEDNMSKILEKDDKSKIKLNENSRDSNKKKSSKRNATINIIKIKNVNIGKIYNKKKILKGENKNLYLNKKKNEIKRNRKYQIKKSSFKKINVNYNKDKNNIVTLDYNNLNDYELNNLEYKDALIIDKRTFFQYYWSLLKKKQLILFTFCPAKDYNLISIKITLFLLSFSLYFTITGFFFDNETMHNIFIDNGYYNIIYELPKIVFSSLITTIINILLKQFSLSEKHFISIKQEKLLKIKIDRSVRIKGFLKIKFAIFFILSNLLLIFFLYFISCFCGIFPNTQIILISDTLLSLSLSMIYPFFIYLLPVIFRISALRAKKKDKVFLYKFGYIISLL